MATTEQLLQKISLALSYIVQNQDGFSDDQALQVAELYPAWHTGVNYRIGQVVRHGGKLYRCAQAHLSQADWAPDVAASLWSGISYTNGVEDWKKPTGEHDAYNVGDHVMYGGAEWVSTVNANTWAPDVYGWEKVN